MSNVVSLRLDQTQVDFLNKVKGDLKIGEAIKLTISYLMLFDPLYTTKILKETGHKSGSQSLPNIQ